MKKAICIVLMLLPNLVFVPFSEAIDLKKETNRIVWEANALFRVYNENHFAEVVLMDYAVESFNKGRASDSIVGNVIKAAKEAYHATSSVELARDFQENLMLRALSQAKSLDREIFSSLCNKRIKTIVDFGENVPNMDPNEEIAKTIATAYTLANRENTQAFSKLFDSCFSDILKTDILQDAESILARNERLRSIKLFDDLLHHENITFNTEYIKAFFSQTAETLKYMFDSTHKAVSEYGNIKDYPTISNFSLHTKNIDSKISESSDLNAARASFFALSTVATMFGDTRLARNINIVGNGIINIAGVFNKYRDSVSNLNNIKNALGTIAFSGNVASIALNMYSLLSKDSIGQQDPLAQELEQISNQLDQIRNEMHARFNQIDKKIDLLYKTMQENFSAINQQLQNISRNVEVINENLLRIQNKLSEIENAILLSESNISKLLLDKEWTELKGDLLKAFKYESLYPGPKMSKAFFYGMNRRLIDFVVIRSKSAIAVGITPDTQLENIAKNLSGKSYDANLKYLAILAKEKFELPLVSDIETEIANPYLWAYSANALIQFYKMHREYIKDMEPSIKLAIEPGSQLLRLIRSIQNKDFFIRLLNGYNNSVSKLFEVMKTENNRLTKKGFDVWEDYNQDTLYEPDCLRGGWMIRQEAYWDGDFTLVCPNPQLIKRVIPKYYLNAEAAGLGNIKVLFHEKPCVLNNPNCLAIVSGIREFKQTLYRDQFGIIFSIAFFPTGKDVSLPIWTTTLYSDNCYPMARRVFGMDQLLPGKTQYQVEAELLRDNWTTGENLKSKLETKLENSETTIDVNHLAFKALNASAYLKLAKDRLAIYRNAFIQVDSEHGTENIGKMIDSYKAALRAYISIGLPETLRRSDLLFSLLFGDQSIQSLGDIKKSTNYDDLFNTIAAIESDKTSMSIMISDEVEKKIFEICRKISPISELENVSYTHYNQLKELVEQIFSKRDQYEMNPLIQETLINLELLRADITGSIDFSKLPWGTSRNPESPNIKHFRNNNGLD
jgi:uncharacterized membrane-anchored protein YhcB (DUF1043 family)